MATPTPSTSTPTSPTPPKGQSPWRKSRSPSPWAPTSAATFGAQDLPFPAYDQSTFPNLSITSSGSVVTIETIDGTNLIISVTQPLSFTLPGIQVGTIFGEVPLTVTEFSPSGPKVEDGSNYKLQKQKVTMPVTDFWAEPSTLYNLDQSVTLYWSCNSLGSSYSYSLGAPNWQPRDCVNSGNCYTVQDGKDGVTSLNLDQKTTFALDVIQAQPDGSRTTIGSLSTTVNMLVPSIVSGQNSVQALYFSGWVARLNWVVENASSCTVSLGNVAIDSNAPLDTWTEGYFVAVPAMGKHQLTLTAVGPPGSSPATLSFAEFKTSSPFNVAVGSNPQGISITPDGTPSAGLALVANNYDNNVSVIEIASRKAEKPNRRGRSWAAGYRDHSRRNTGIRHERDR